MGRGGKSEGMVTTLPLSVWAGRCETAAAQKQL